MTLPHSVDAGEFSYYSCKTFGDGDPLCGKRCCMKSARLKTTIAGHLEASIRFSRDRYGMDPFRVVMNKREAQMRIIDDKISCAKTPQELFASEVINNRGDV